MQTKTTWITPDEARQILKRSEGALFHTTRGTAYRNRSVVQSVVDKYAKDMTDGNWRLTHQGIAIDSLGRIVDGQHRLHAIVAANVAAPMQVTTDADTDNFWNIDSGRPRAAYAFLDGQLGKARVTLANALIRLDQLGGLADHTIARSGWAPHIPLSYLEEHPDVSEYVIKYGKEANKAVRRGGFTGVSAGGLLLGGYCVGDDYMQDAFWNDVNAMSSGAGLPDGNPVRALWRVQRGDANFTALSYLRALYAAVKWRDGKKLDIIRDCNCKTVRVY